MVRHRRAGLRLWLGMVGYTQCPRGAATNFRNGGIVAATLIFGTLTAEIKINLCFHRNTICSVLIGFKSLQFCRVGHHLQVMCVS